MKSLPRAPFLLSGPDSFFQYTENDQSVSRIIGTGRKDYDFGSGCKFHLCFDYGTFCFFFRPV